jgi:hypothetical protein
MTAEVLTEPSPMAIAGTVWSARCVVLGYLIAYGLAATATPETPRLRERRRWWTFAVLCLTVHTLIAFAGVHHGSHAAAWERTRVQTLALTGWNSGFGLWVNFATLAVWWIDVALWYRQPLQRTPSRFNTTWQTLLAFVMLNATVIFGPAVWRILAVLFTVAAVVMIVRRAHRAASRSVVRSDHREFQVLDEGLPAKTSRDDSKASIDQPVSSISRNHTQRPS